MAILGTLKTGRLIEVGRLIELSNTAADTEIIWDFKKWPLNGGWPLKRWPLNGGSKVKFSKQKTVFTKSEGIYSCARKRLVAL